MTTTVFFGQILNVPHIAWYWYALVLMGLILASSFVVIHERQVGIVVKRFSSRSLPPGRFVALNGEAGYQADTLAPGVHFGYWRWQFRVTKVPVTVVAQGQIALVIAADGAPIPAERILGKAVDCDNFQDARRFLLNGGEKGRQLEILTAGTYRINRALFTVISYENAAEHGMAPDHVDVSGLEFKHGDLVNVGHKGVWVTPLYPGKHPVALAAYDVQAIDTLIGDINPPAELMHTQTDRKIAEEQRKTYEVQEAAQIQRQQLVRQTALADIQQQVVGTEQGVNIAELKASASVKQATGEAEAVRLRAHGDAEAIRVTGHAKAEAYRAGVEALGQQSYTVMQLMQTVGERNVRIVPDVAVSGANSNPGLVDGLLGLMSVTGAAAKARNPVGRGACNRRADHSFFAARRSSS